MLATVDEFHRDDLIFPIRDTGARDGAVVVLLHGFPQSGSSWDRVVPGLTAAGYRCLAPDQRGYAAGARPRGRRAYRVAELVADVEALIDASGAAQAHLVGHDWGAAVAWAVAAKRPDRIATLTALSVPHPAAFSRALVCSRQALASWYIYAIQLPLLAEHFLRSRDGARFAALLGRAGQQATLADRDARFLIDTGALTPALNWYRGLPFARRDQGPGRVTVPTLYVWSDRDTAVLRQAADRCGDYVRGPFRYEVLEGVSHWIPVAAPADTTRLIIAHLAEHPISVRPS
jgi:pimeloyl-ACP methyl ester carboxylesterase